MPYQFYSAKKLLEIIEQSNFNHIWEVTLRAEKDLTKRSEEEIFENMKKRLRIMKEAISRGQESCNLSKSGMVCGESIKMKGQKGQKLFMSETMRKATEYALGVMESNARMGKIVAAPTAGASGVIPGVIFAVQEEFNLDEDTAVKALLTAAGIGLIIAHIGTFSAAKAGCQAEIGSSTAMAAAAVSFMRGMSPERCCNAAAIALKNLLGLACDPIAGLVEVPCIKRNAIGAVHALTASDMSLAGITSIVPFDEVIDAMNNIATKMDSSIRETAKGGLACTPTGQKIQERIRERMLKRSQEEHKNVHKNSED